MEEYEKAKDKIMMGAERRSMVMGDDEKALQPTMKLVTQSLVGPFLVMTRFTK